MKISAVLNRIENDWLWLQRVSVLTNCGPLCVQWPICFVPRNRRETVLMSSRFFALAALKESSVCLNSSLLYFSSRPQVHFHKLRCVRHLSHKSRAGFLPALFPPNLRHHCGMYNCSCYHVIHLTVYCCCRDKTSYLRDNFTDETWCKSML